MLANKRRIKQYQRILAVGRQFTHLARVNGSVVTGLHALKDIAGDKHKAIINGLERAFINDESIADKQLQHSIGPYAILRRLIQVIDKERGDSLKALDNFDQLLKSVNEENRALWLSASGLIIYLVAVLLIAAVVSTIVVIFVVPQYQDFFANARANLPALTEFIVSGNGVVLALMYGVVGACMFALTLMVMRVYHVTSSLQPFEKLQHIPFLEPLCKTYNRLLAMNFTRLLMMSGVTQERSLSAAAELANDKGLADIAAGKIPRRSNDVLDAISLAKHAGNIEAELDYQINDSTYQLSGEFTVLREKTLLFLHLFIAVVVGLFVIAMYLPIFKMGEIA